MNIHPIFVHFPIALLIIYTIAELIRFKKITDLPYYFYIKAVLVIIGTLTSSLALSTGESAEEIIGRSNLIETHSTYANISSYIFGFLSIVYLILWISKTEWSNKLLVGRFAKIWALKINIANKILTSSFSIFIAIAGLIAITIASALGGAIVYGQNVDPIVNFIYNLVM